jgi:hypothetical protein
LTLPLQSDWFDRRQDQIPLPRLTVTRPDLTLLAMLNTL